MGSRGFGIDCVVFDLDGTLTVAGSTRPVAGTAEVVARLARADVALAVATSAPVTAARRVLADLDLDRWFISVAGAAPNAGTTTKDAIVAEALLGLGRPLPDGARGAAMVGDGAGDMVAAVRHGLVPVGATWGGGCAARLRDAGAVVVLDDPWQLLGVVPDPAPSAAGPDPDRDDPADP